MKSLIQEASSIERAIDKAWNEAGKPRSFTIEVLDEGEKSFFGFSRRTAKVSILFDQAEVTFVQERKQRRAPEAPKRVERVERADRSPVPERDSRVAAGLDPRKRTTQRAPREGGRSNDQGRDLMRDVRDNRPYETPLKEVRLVREEKPVEPQRPERLPQPEEWTVGMQNFADENLRQILQLCGLTGSFRLSAQGKTLTISFAQSVIEDQENQRMFFASLSYLLIQFIKREHKYRFTGFKVVVMAEGSDPVEGGDDIDLPRVPRPDRSSERSAGSDRRGSSSSRYGNKDRRDSRENRDSRPPRIRVPEAEDGDNGSIFDEQRRFAQQQLAQDQESMHEQASVEHSRVTHSNDVDEVDPFNSDVHNKERDIVAEMRRAASQEQEKYQPFYVVQEAGKKAFPKDDATTEDGE